MLEQSSWKLANGDRAFGLHSASLDGKEGEVLMSCFRSLQGVDGGGIKLVHTETSPDRTQEDLVSGVEFRNTFYSSAHHLLMSATPAMVLVLRERKVADEWTNELLERMRKKDDLSSSQEQANKLRVALQETDQKNLVLAVQQWVVASPEQKQSLFDRTRRVAVSLNEQTATLAPDDLPGRVSLLRAACVEFRGLLETHPAFLPALLALANLEASAEARTRYRDLAQKSKDALCHEYFQQVGLSAACEPSSSSASPLELSVLGLGLWKGYGVLATDPQKAAALFRVAMERGDACGAANYGLCLLHGEGVEPNQEQALSALHTAALRGHAVGACNYATQLPGDAEDSKKFLRMAADAGNEIAIRQLWDKLQADPLTKAEGMSWIQQAASAGSQEAKRLLAQSEEGEKILPEQEFAARKFGRAKWVPIAAARVKTSGGVWHVSCSPNGRWMAVATDDIGVLVYDLEALKPESRDDYLSLARHAKPPPAPTFSFGSFSSASSAPFTLGTSFSSPSASSSFKLPPGGVTFGAFAALGSSGGAKGSGFSSTSSTAFFSPPSSSLPNATTSTTTSAASTTVSESSEGSNNTFTPNQDQGTSPSTSFSPSSGLFASSSSSFGSTTSTVNSASTASPFTASSNPLFPASTFSAASEAPTPSFSFPIGGGFSGFAFPSTVDEPRMPEVSSQQEQTQEQKQSAPFCTPSEHEYFVKNVGSSEMPTLPTLRPHMRLPCGEPYACFFSPDGRYLAAAGYSRSVCIWHIGVEEKLDKAHTKEGGMPCDRGSVRWKVSSFSTSNTVWKVMWLPTAPGAPLRLLALADTQLLVYGTQQAQDGEEQWVALGTYKLPGGSTNFTVAVPPAQWWGGNSQKFLVATANGAQGALELWVLEEKTPQLQQRQVASNEPTFYMGDSEDENMHERIAEDEGEEDVELLKVHLASVAPRPNNFLSYCVSTARSLFTRPSNSPDMSLSRVAVCLPFEDENEQYSVELVVNDAEHKGADETQESVQNGGGSGVKVMVASLQGNVKVFHLAQPTPLQSLNDAIQETEQAARDKEELRKSRRNAAECMKEAAEAGDLRTMQTLQQDPSSLEGAIFAAVRSRKQEVVEWLIAQQPDIVNHTEPKPGWDLPLVNTPLLEACHTRDLALVELLLKSKANPLQENCHDGGPLTFAAVEKDGALLKLFAKYKVDFNHPSGLYCNGETPLHMAAFWDHDNNVATLIDAGHNPNAADGRGRTVLEFTCTRKLLKSFRVLLSKGAQASAKCVLVTAEEFLNGKGEEEAACEMLTSLLPLVGPIRDLRDPDNGRSPLHLAAQAGWARLAALLLGQGVPLDAKDRQGRVAAQLISKKAGPELAALLEVK